MNVIEIRPGSGAYISSLSAERLIEHLEFVYFLDPKSISQLYEARRTLELSTVSLAAERVTDDELAKMEDAVVQMKRADEKGDPDEAYKWDQVFHNLIATASRNPLLAQFVEVIGELMGTGYRKEILAMRGTVTTPGEDHQRILDALKRRDSEAAQSAMLLHLTHSEEGYRSLSATRNKQSPEE